MCIPSSSYITTYITSYYLKCCNNYDFFIAVKKPIPEDLEQFNAPDKGK